MALQSTETRAFLQLDYDKQRRIVEASIDEFAEKGYEKASMNMVVKKAGISKGALFNYFVNKSGLFGFIYRLVLKQVKYHLRAVREESRGQDFFLRMEKVMKAGVDFVRCYPGPAQVYYRIIFTGDAPFKDEILEELHGESLKFIQSLVEEGINRGDLRPDLDTKATAFVLECVLDRFLQAHQLEFLDNSLQLHGASGEEYYTWINKILELFRNGLINGSDNGNVEEKE